VKVDSLKNDEMEIKTIVEDYPTHMTENDNLRDVLSNMLLYGIKEVPVKDGNGNLTGTISYDDIHERIINIYSGNRIKE
jgi:CBS domain-containing protein